MKLTDKEIKSKLKVMAKGHRIADGAGLYLRAIESGRGYWQGRFMVNGKETSTSYGVYPEVGLKEARTAHDECRRNFRKTGLNPNLLRRTAFAENSLAISKTFKVVAEEWFQQFKHERAESYVAKVHGHLKRNVYPSIGSIPMHMVEAPMLLKLSNKVIGKGTIESGHRTLQVCKQVFDYAIACGLVKENLCSSLKQFLTKPTPKHMAAILDPIRLGECLRAIYGYKGGETVNAALKLITMLMVRPGELRLARWDEFNFDESLWTIPSMRMKRQHRMKVSGDPHLVSLPVQAVEILRELHASGNGSGFVFKGQRDHERPMSDAALNAALRAMNFSTRDEVTGHGFRATARTFLEERLNYRAEIIEAQLAHSVKDSLGRAYNRTSYLQDRAEMMQSWADYLDVLRQTSSGALIKLSKYAADVSVVKDVARRGLTDQRPSASAP